MGLLQKGHQEFIDMERIKKLISQEEFNTLPLDQQKAYLLCVITLMDDVQRYRMYLETEKMINTK